MQSTSLSPYANYEDTQTKRLQVIYLKEVEHLTAKQISKFVDYSLSTIRNYISKFRNLLEEAKRLFTRKEVEIISKVKNLGKSGEEKCYLFKFYQDKKILFTKVGTTTREVMTRLKEEIRSYTKSGFPITKVIIENVFDCGNIPAEGLESFCRAKFILDYPNTFKKNDRFMGVDIPVEKFNSIMESYLR